MQYILFDSQRLSSLQSCPQKFEYSFERNLTRIDTPKYFDIGTIIHRAMKLYYATLKYKERWFGSYGYDSLVRTCIKVAEYWGLQLLMPPPDIQDVVKILNQYFEYYRNDPSLANEILGCEQYFANPCGSSFMFEGEEYQVVIEGRIDLIFIDRTNGLPIIWDHKHESQKREFSQLSNQFMIYPWATGAKNLVVNVIGTQKTKEPNEKFYRKQFQYDEDLIAEFEKDVIEEGKRYLEYRHNKKFPRYRSSCNTYGICEFERVCSVGPELREMRLERDFKKRVWSPFN